MTKLLTVRREMPQYELDYYPHALDYHKDCAEESILAYIKDWIQIKVEGTVVTAELIVPESFNLEFIRRNEELANKCCRFENEIKLLRDNIYELIQERECFKDRVTELSEENEYYNVTGDIHFDKG